jgi:hypothetical protein
MAPRTKNHTTPNALIVCHRKSPPLINSPPLILSLPFITSHPVSLSLSLALWVAINTATTVLSPYSFSLLHRTDRLYFIFSPPWRTFSSLTKTLSPRSEPVGSPAHLLLSRSCYMLASLSRSRLTALAESVTRAQQ